MTDEDLLTLAEAQKSLGIRSRKTLLKYIHAGELRAFKLGGTRWRILRRDFEAFLMHQRDGKPRLSPEAGMPIHGMDNIRRPGGPAGDPWSH